MKPTRPLRDKARLLATAQAVAVELKQHCEGTSLRVRIPTRCLEVRTDGWRACIGDLGKNRQVLEIWLDRITGYPDRKWYAGFYAPSRRQIEALTKRLAKKLWPVRTVELKDVSEDRHLVFNERLRRSEFNAPIVEKYSGGRTFYGIYDPTRKTSDRVNPNFVSRAVAFFEDVARSLPRAAVASEQHEVYPQNENRAHVVSHLQRERSRLLAAECKIHDGYKCRVCGFRFDKRYGKLGEEFAEAHHLVPLGKLRGQTRTRLEDLATVCANCHRMLHRMEGERGDLAKLRKIVANRK